MKNIHLIPTDKPSRLAKHSSGSFHIVSYIAHKKGLYKITNQHIYITNDEEIKEGDWFYDLDTKYVKVNQSWKNSNLDLNGKKIILTTDPDLIKDGVQAIDDEFLEWFVKNPSCVFVEVEKKDNWYTHTGSGKYWEDEPVRMKRLLNLGDYEYKIIIPQEEFTIINGGDDIVFPSSTTITFKPLPDVNWESDITNKVWDEEEPKQIKCYCDHTITCDCEPLQETIEEASWRFNPLKKLDGEFLRDAFIKGAKWQQKRMYSEEDMINFHKWAYQKNRIEESDKTTKELLKEWFEQFKKK